jgi:hypothetical protein
MRAVEAFRQAHELSHGEIKSSNVINELAAWSRVLEIPPYMETEAS